VSTLLEGGFDLSALAPFHTAKAADFLNRCLADGHGAVGFGTYAPRRGWDGLLTRKAPQLGADADDTSKTILILNLLNHATSPDTLLKQFEDVHYFKTYPLERDPSFSANCNVLVALLHVQEPFKYSPQIEKTVKFLWTKYQDSQFAIRDKWVGKHQKSSHVTEVLICDRISLRSIR